TVPTKDQNIFLFASIFVSWLLSFFVAIPELHAINTLGIKEYGIQALLAFVVNGFGYIFWIRANRIAKEKNIPIARLASLLYLLPFLALLVVAVFLKEGVLLQSYFLFCLAVLIVSS